MLLLKWILLLQEFDVELKDKNGAENVVADHLSQFPNDHIKKTSKTILIDNSFADDSLIFTLTGINEYNIVTDIY